MRQIGTKIDKLIQVLPDWLEKGCCPDRSLIPIYRYTEVRKAIDNGELIWWVEGESCADALWALGIPATTSIQLIKEVDALIVGGTYNGTLRAEIAVLAKK
jgi:hypothetical protein